jgi:hypothetical protein
MPIIHTRSKQRMDWESEEAALLEAAQAQAAAQAEIESRLPHDVININKMLERHQ